MGTGGDRDRTEMRMGWGQGLHGDRDGMGQDKMGMGQVGNRAGMETGMRQGRDEARDGIWTEMG